MKRSQSNIFLRSINDCRLLLRELEHQIADLEFKQKGGKIHYAVDFSEIYAYVRPDQTSKEFRLFVDKTVQEAATIQRQTLRRLFEKQPGRLILLNPYVIELHSFVVRERQQYIRYADRYLKGSSSWESDAVTEAYNRINQIGAEVAAVPRELASGEIQLITDFLADHAPGLIELFVRHDRQPLEVIKRLFAADRFADLNTLVPVEMDSTSPQTNDWYQRLLKIRLGDIELDKRQEEFIRVEPNTQLDALALALVEGTNAHFKSLSEEPPSGRVAPAQGAKHETRLLLVTRSYRMHQLFHNDPLASPLRHPRIFSDLFSSDVFPSGRLNQLRERADALRIFLEAVEQKFEEQRLADDEPDLSENEQRRRAAEAWTELKPEVKKLKRSWRSAEGLAMSVEFASPLEADAQPLSSDQARKFLVLLRDQEALKAQLFTRLKEVVTDLDHYLELLGFYLNSATKHQQERIVATFRTQDDDYKRDSSRLIAMEFIPYTLRFYSREARRLVTLIGKTRNPDKWQDVRAFLETGFAPGKNFERLLAMAAILGALNKWPLAEKYAERALQIASEERSFSSEGNYFLAICKRKTDRSAERHLEAIERLDAALASQRKPDGSWRHPALRYLREKATHILMLTTYYPNEAEGYSVDDGLRLLDEVEEASNSNEDLLLKSQTINARLYYHLETNHLEEREKLLADLRNLEATLHQLDPDKRKWPLATIDTIAFAHWKLGLIRTAEEREAILELLNNALEATHAEPKVLEHLEKRYDEISKSPIAPS